MSHDQQTYQRAVAASLLGFGVQLAAAGTLLILSLWLRSAVVTTVTWHAFGGLLLWLALAVIYQQHRLERIESLEAEELARTHGTESSIFETSAEDLSVARRRLGRLQRWALPIVSLLTAGYLIGVGGWLLWKNVPLLQIKALARDTLETANPQKYLVGAQALEQPGLMMAAMVGLFFATFVVSRYLAGMAKAKEWSMLRGGAGYLMGVSLVSAAMGLGYGLLFVPSILLLKYLVVAIPGFMVLVGVEMLLNLVLDVYRPRKAGELPRPAFDSRLLSLLTSPESIAKTLNEAINYQFGFEISRSWFWQLLSRAFGWLVLLSAAVLIAISTVVIVEPSEQAMVTRFGRITGEPLGPGLHFKLPWPIDGVRRVDTGRVMQIAAGSLNRVEDLKPDMPILWANEHYQIKPSHLIVAPAPAAPDAAPSGVDNAEEGGAEPARTPANSLVNVEMMVQFRVSDVMAYLTVNSDPVLRLQDMTNLELSRYMLRRDIDEWIGPARQQAATELKQLIQQAADEAKLGVEVLTVSVASVHPPQEVAEAFHQSVTALQEQQTEIETARKNAIEVLAEVAGTTERAERIVEEIEQLERMRGGGTSAEQIAQQESRIEILLRNAGGTASEQIAQARADRWTRENQEIGQARLYQQQLLAYREAPIFYKMRNYLAALTEGLAEARKYVIIADRESTTVRLNLQKFETGFSQLDLGAQE